MDETGFRAVRRISSLFEATETSAPIWSAVTRSGLAATVLLAGIRFAQGAGLDLSAPQTVAQIETPSAPAVATSARTDGIADYFANWYARVDSARSSQPDWSSPLVTTSSLLQQRVRFDTVWQRAGNGTNTTVIDNGKGLEVIPWYTQELDISAAPYDVRTTPTGKGELEGFGDWPFFRFKQRLASSPTDQGDYAVSTWLQLQAPTGSGPFSNNAWTLLPTIGAGKGWGPFVVQGTLGGIIPTAYESKTGSQIATNVAFQLRLFRVFWPQIEVNWTYWPDGQRGGLNQVFLTPGIVIGRLPIMDRFKFTIGIGYQVAIAPSYRLKPLTPTYNNALIVTTRVNF